MPSASAVLILCPLACGLPRTVGDASGDSSPGTGDDEVGSEEAGEEVEGGTWQDDALFADFEVRSHAQVKTLLEVNWQLLREVDHVWVEYSYDDGLRRESPRRTGDEGEHSALLLGIPEGVEASLRLVAQNGDELYESTSLDIVNARAPDKIPRPTITKYADDQMSSMRWMMGAVSEKGEGGYQGPHWIYIVDRRGRIVWYYRPAGGENGELNQSFWPRIARDGRHFTLDQQRRGTAGEILFATLDFSYRKTINLGLMSDAYDITDEGTIIYDDRKNILTRDREGEKRTLWGCPWAICYTNTVNWDPRTDTIIISLLGPPGTGTDKVIQIDHSSGFLLRTFDNQGDWRFDPDHHGFEMPHWPHLTDEGTLLVSTHLPDNSAHLFVEYELDSDQKTLREQWSYGHDSDDFPNERGMVAEVGDGSGNLLGNYGPAGVVVELTRDGKQAWRAEFGPHLLGNSFLLDDLYALNRGPKSQL